MIAKVILKKCKCKIIKQKKKARKLESKKARKIIALPSIVLYYYMII